jgi:hypothetical protein
MDWNRFFLDIQATPLSTWIRESPSLLGMPALLIVHAIGMGFLVGTSYALSLRVFGFAPSIPLQSMKAIVPLMRVAFWLNATSGLLLLLGFPLKNIRNPVFFLKLTLIAMALLNTSLILRRCISDGACAERARSVSGKILAGCSLLLWTAAVISGRLLFYTYPHLNSSGEPF